MFAQKVKVTKKTIEEAFKQFVRENAGEGENKLYVFDLCSMYGVGLADSTIDEIRINGYGEVEFVYNANEGDYDNIMHFSYRDLRDFYYGIVDAWNEEMSCIEFENRGEGKGEW